MADRKILNLEVSAGLCNRLRALVAGICWAKQLDRNLVVFWPSYKPECAARFNDLFQTSFLPDFVEVVDRQLTNPMSCLQEHDAKHIFYVNHHESFINIKSHGNFWCSGETQEKEKEMYLYYLRTLRPSFQVEKVLDAWRQGGLNSTGTAFHIRMTDNEKAIRLSPVGLFMEKLFQIEGPIVLFSDEEKVVGALKSLFQDKILSFESIRRRNTIQGMVEAAAVFFALAGKQTIFGSANSSFSEIAREYGGNELIVISST